MATQITASHGFYVSQTVGPHVDANGNVYVIATTASGFKTYKASNPLSSWSLQNDASAPSTGPAGNGFSSYIIGNEIRCVYYNTSGSDTQFTEHGFNVSSHGTPDVYTSASGFNTLTGTAFITGSAFGVARSDGSQIFHHSRASDRVHGTDYSRVGYSRKVSGSWTLNIDTTTVPGAQADHFASCGIGIDGSDDGVYFGQTQQSSGTLYIRKLTSANVLESGFFTQTSVQIGAHWQSPRIVWNGMPGTLSKMYFTYRTNTGVFSSNWTRSIGSWTNGTAREISTDEHLNNCVANLVAHGDVIYCVFGAQSDTDMYYATSQEGGTWGTAVKIETCNLIIAQSARAITRSGVRKLAVAYEDSSAKLQYTETDLPKHPKNRGWAQTNENSDSTSHTLNMPSNIAAGELLIAYASVDGNPDVTVDTGYSGTGWVKLGQRSTLSNNVCGSVFYKTAVGGDLLRLNTSASEHGTYIVARYEGGGTVTGDNAASTSSNANPPNHNPGSSADRTWISFASWDAATVGSAAPTNYVSRVLQANDATGASTGYADRYLTASSEDPGTFTSSSAPWVTWTVSIAPPVSGISGTLAATETGSDTAAVSGTVKVTGSLAATDSPDVAAIAAAVAVSGTCAATETGADVAAVSAALYVTGTLAATETGADVALIEATVSDAAINATLTATETGSDTSSITAQVAVAGTLAAAEVGADTAALSAAVTVAASLAATEVGADTVALSAVVTVAASMAATEAGSDTAAVTATLDITGSLTATETGIDTAAITATVPVSAAVAAVEAGQDVAAVTATVVVSATLSATEVGSDVSAITAAVAVSGSLAATEVGEDVALITGNVAWPGISGTLIVTEAGADTAAVAVSVVVSASLTATEVGSDTAAITAAAAVSGSLAASEIGSDTASVTAAVIVGATLSATDAPDAAAIAGTVVVSGSLAASEVGEDTAAISATVAVAASLAVTEVGEDTAVVTAQVLVAAQLAASDDPDVAAIVAQVAVAGTLAASEVGADLAYINAGSGIAMTLTAVEVGADTAALSATVVVAASLAVSEVGADTANVSGLVPVAATVSAAEIGFDTAVITGLLGRTAQLAATEVGSDVAAATMQVVVTATMGASDDADTSAITGSVLLTGTLDAVESGSDTASINAGSGIAMSLLATEAGSDVAAAIGTAEVLATISAVESGTDTALISGNVAWGAILATILATEIGDDIASVQATVATPAAAKLALDVVAERHVLKCDGIVTRNDIVGRIVTVDVIGIVDSRQYVGYEAVELVGVSHAS